MVRDQRLVLRNMPMRGSLVTAGQQGSIPEDALWRAENVSCALDGMLVKRPGLYQWGQTLRWPARTSDYLWFYEPFDTLDKFDVSIPFPEYFAIQTADNKLIVTIRPVTGFGSLGAAIRRRVMEQEQDADTDDFTVRFTIQTINITGQDGITIGCRTKLSNNIVRFVVRSDKVEYYDSSYDVQTFAEYDFETQASNAIEIRYDADGNTTLYINDVLVGTVASSVFGLYTDANEYYVGLGFFQSAGTVITSRAFIVSDLMFEATADGTVTQRLGAGTDFKTVLGGPTTRSFLVVAGENYVYRDTDRKQLWTPLLSLVGGNVSFAQYQDELLIFDSDNGVRSQVYRWTGKSAPKLVDDAPPVRFGTEHRTRVFAAGDKTHPLRLYFSASNDPNTWFAPDSDADGQETYDEVVNAGYLNIPGEKGDEITAVEGEFFGSCIVCTNRGIWRVTGSSPRSFVRENITTSVGVSAQAATARMGNDLWLAGRQGISTIQTVQQFGDMKSTMPSATIADLWAQGTGNTEYKIDQFQLYKASMAWNPTLSLMYFAFARQGADEVSSILVYNPVTQGWYGPWASDTTFVQQVEAGNPVTQVVMHGTSVGKVGLTDPGYKTDFGDDYTMTIESPYLSGRTLDPDLQHRTKTWKTLRIFYQMRGEWPLTVRWQTDDSDWQETTAYTNSFKYPRLGTDWRLNVDPDGKVHSAHLIGVVEVQLDARGRYLKFQIVSQQDTVGEDFAIQGTELEFTASGFEEE